MFLWCGLELVGLGCAVMRFCRSDGLAGISGWAEAGGWLAVGCAAAGDWGTGRRQVTRGCLDVGWGYVRLTWIAAGDGLVWGFTCLLEVWDEHSIGYIGLLVVGRCGRVLGSRVKRSIRHSVSCLPEEERDAEERRRI